MKAKARAAAGGSARRATGRRAGRGALILFLAEQGFAGAFSERVLDAVAADVVRFARHEGLTAHAQAVAVRREGRA